jgi:spermidine synthase
MPALVLIFAAASGAAALLYEIVWFQMLELVIGSTAVSVGLLLAAYMGGLGAGSLAFPYFSRRAINPLRLYGVIEGAIGLFALVVLFAMPLVSGAFGVAFLLPPTFFMGAALPALGRVCSDKPSMGLLYAANIAGGVVGCLAGGFYLLREFNVTVATLAGFGVNLAIAIVAFAFARKRDPPVGYEPVVPVHGDYRVYAVIAMSGLCALAAETIWTRVLGLLFGSSVYSLTIILAVFLVGLGAGSWIGVRLRDVAKPRPTLAKFQILASVAIWWAARSLSVSLPYWPVNPVLSPDPWFNLQLDFVRACWAILPATVIWGASFPLALAAASPSHERAAFPRVYAFNTIGAIVGALAASLILIPWIGVQGAQRVLIGISVAAGLLLASLRLMIATIAIAILLIWGVPPKSDLLIAYGRYSATWVGKSDIFYAADGMNSSVALARFPDGRMTFHVAGKIQASTAPRDLRLQRMLGHLTTLTAARPRSVLVIGCGAGVTAGAVSVDPLVERETIVEIEPLVFDAARNFGDANLGVLENQKVRRVLDDGRHFLLATRERFDGITVDPLDPWAKGAASLYTEEIFQTMREHLNPGGTVTMYIQLFETTPDAVKSAVATFMKVFPHATIWANTNEGRGYDMVLLGQAGPLQIDLDEMERRVDFHGDSPMSESLAGAGFDSPVALFATYAGRGEDLDQWLVDASINRDRNLRMQYLAGLGMDYDDAAEIFSSMTQRVRFPDGVFRSGEGRLDSLKRTWDMSRARR